MCGIAGYFSKKSVSGEEYYKIHKCMSNRGPDDEGFVVIESGQVKDYYGDNSHVVFSPKSYIKCCEQIFGILSHVRLSILDLTNAGHQPFYSDDNRYVMVYNGEIYNYVELRDILNKKGYTFRTETDTEVLLKAYVEWGTDAFNRFNGMWAIAIYDVKTGKVILSRDRFGIKPLFYSVSENVLAFGSMMSVVRRLISQSTPDLKTIDNYLRRGKIVINKDTFFQEIKELEPGCYAEIIQGHKIDIKRYWTFRPYYRKYSSDEALEIFSGLFEDSVRIRMRSDVEVGSLLSGGLDSTTIAGTLWQKGLMSDRYQTFSSVYEEEAYSERKYIEESQKKMGFRTNYIYISAEEALDMTDKTIAAIEMPYRSASANLQYKLYQQIHQNSNIKVVVNGQGADELFGGYTIDYANRFADLICTGHFLKCIDEINSFCKIRNISKEAAIYYVLRAIVIAKGMHGRNTFNLAQFSEVTVSALREYLTYDDRLAMAFGIESRAPFIDFRIVEFAFSLGSELKINEEYNKAIVRHYAKDIIPKSILERKDKMGFVSPQETWQRVEWKNAFDDEYNYISRHGLFDYDIDKIIRHYNNYKANSEDWTLIWRFFCLSRWRRMYEKT